MKSGADYTAASDRLILASSETEKTVSVAVLDDSHDDGQETLRLVFSNASGVRIADAEAILAAQWIHLGDGTAGDAATYRAAEEEAQARLADPLDRLRGGNQADRTRGLSSRTVTGRDLLTELSFALTVENEKGGYASQWGRGAVLRFSARADVLSLDGEVTSAMLGAACAHGPWTARLIVSHASGDGGTGSRTSGTRPGRPRGRLSTGGIVALDDSRQESMPVKRPTSLTNALLFVGKLDIRLGSVEQKARSKQKV